MNYNDNMMQGWNDDMKRMQMDDEYFDNFFDDVFFRNNPILYGVPGNRVQRKMRNITGRRDVEI